MAQIEIEYKFRIDSHQVSDIKKQLQTLAHTHATIDKSDIYYRYKNTEDTILDIRLRRHTEIIEDNESVSFFLTYKKTLHNDDGGEVNQEFETKIEDCEVIEHIITTMGARVLIKKTKRGDAYSMPLMLNTDDDNGAFDTLVIYAEFIEVEPLGYFFEIEVVVDMALLAHMKERGDGDYIALIQKKLLAMAYALGIEQSQLESRKYIDLLGKPL